MCVYKAHLSLSFFYSLPDFDTHESVAEAFEGVSTAGYTLLNANIESSLGKPK